MQQNNVEKFLNDIHGNDKINFRVIHNDKGSKNLKGTYQELREKLQYYNDNNYNIYFVVNGGGTHNYEINKINAVFVDFDMGKDENKKYYPLSKVEPFKKECLNKVDQFKFKPSYIIETRNGIHVYWLVDNSATNEQFLDCQLRLIQYFKSDTAVKTLERVMRLPDYYWCKDIDNKFMCKIIEYNNIKYSVEDIINELPECNIDNDVVKGFCVEDKEVKKYNYSSFHTKSNLHIEAIKNGDIELLQALIKPEGKEFMNQNDFYRYITEDINLGELLGLNDNKFNCIFHNDHSPSAGLFISSRNQHFYKCHSSCCGFMGNIIRCVERLRKCNRPKAINFIKEVYKLSISETDWQKEQKQILEENKRMIRDGELEEYYPEIYKLVKRYSGLLYELHDIAKDNTYDERYSDEQNNVIFFSSVNTICQRLGIKMNNRMSDKIGVLAFLLMINKLSESQVPEKYLNKAKSYAAKHKQKNIVNFYSIPSYCDSQLLQSLERALLFQKNNVSMRGWSRELLQRTFGEDIANEVYPMFTHRKVSKKSDERTKEIHDAVIHNIEIKGYSTEKDVIEELRYKFGKTKTEAQIKKSLQEMLYTYGLERVRLNKELKNKLNINIKGYPYIIYKNK